MLKLIAVIASLAALIGPAQADIVSNAHYYANQTPYGNPATTSIKTPPPGYELVFLENLGRHGSRSQTSTDSEKRALAVWSAASRQGKLSTPGKQFDDDLREFQAAEREIGYGRLSAIGRAEWIGIGRRTAANYHDFLTKAAADDDDIEFRSTSVYRTQQSASSLLIGLRSGVSGLDFQPRTVDDRMLITSGATSKGNAAIVSVLRRSDVRAAAKDMLHRIYTSSYVNSLSDPVGKALDVYGMYALAAGMQGDTDVTFSRYVPVADARVLGYAKDAQNFYRYGPGVSGETSSYRQARPILSDFLSQLDKRLAGGKTAAVFRLAHGETTMPLAALMRLPGSTKQASAGSPYSYANNTWRGFVAGRMAGNIEWAAYRNPTNGGVLVTLRYNEQPVRLISSCKSSSLDPYFYGTYMLKNCLH